MSWFVGKSTSPFNGMDREKALECAREFMKSPSSRPFSTDLQRLLNRFHGRPLQGRLVLVQIKSWETWCIGRLKGRGLPVELFEDQKFSSIDDGERAIFRLWWKEQTNEELPF